MAIWPGDPVPDAIDMMTEHELRTELRSAVLKLDEQTKRADALDKLANDNYRWGKSLLEEVNGLTSRLDALQAKLDAVMLEYCAGDMTPEQIENWAKHQQPSVVETPVPIACEHEWSESPEPRCGKCGAFRRTVESRV
jgi:hypothetical protein